MDFFQIYDQYYQRVKRFILASVKDEWVADDLVQETFIRVQNNLDKVKDSSKMSSWIFRIAHNLCLDHFRSFRKSPFNECEAPEELEVSEENPVQKTLEQCEMGLCVQRQMDILPRSLRSVIVLFDIMEFNHREIADILDITVDNVKVRLHRARRKLKIILEEKCTFELDERNVMVCEPKNRKTEIEIQ